MPTASKESQRQVQVVEVIKAVICLRVSTKEQERQGFSIEAQRDMCRRFVVEEGWSIAGEFEFAISGRTVARTREFQEMLDVIRADPGIRRLVVVQLDRLLRDTDDFSDVRREMRRLGVQIVSVTERFDDSPGGEFNQDIRVAQAKYESRIIGSRIKRGQLRKLQEGGWPHQARAGYQVVRRNTERRDHEAILVPDPPQAALVLEAFELYAAGEWSMKRLHQEMTNRGLRTPTGTPLVFSKFAKLLQDKLYIGVMEWNGVEYPGYHERLVPKDLFDKVYAVIQERTVTGTRHQKHNHFLRGSVFCGECGSRLSSLTAKGKFRYYFCLGRHRDPRSCGQPYTPLEDLETQFEALYERLPTDLPDDVRQRIRAELEKEIERRTKSGAAILRTAQRKLRDVERRLERLLFAYEKGAIPLEMLQNRQEALTSERQRAERDVTLAGGEVAEGKRLLEQALVRIDQWNQAYKISPEPERRLQNLALIRAAFVKDRRLVAVEFKEPYASLFFQGSSMNPMVEMRGLEPLASALRTRRSTN